MKRKRHSEEQIIGIPKIYETGTSVTDIPRCRSIRLAIDDFGTSYSFLFALKALVISKLKRNLSFVRNIPADSDDMASTRTISALGETLQMHVIAKGSRVLGPDPRLIS